MKVEWPWMVTAGIAAYGALLSTYNALVNRKQSTRQVTVTLSFGLLAHGPDLSDQMILIEAVNPGHRPITLTSVGLQLPDKRQLVLTSSDGTAQLPHQLAEGTSCTYWVPLHQIEEQLRRSGFSGKVQLRGYYLDATGERHLSKPKEVGS